MSSNEDNELLGAFIEESVEHLADIEGDLLAIEQGGAAHNEERVNKVFRSIHSIKGSAGFLGLYGLQNLTHATENVLGLVRTRKLMPTPEVINILLLASDRIKQLLANISCSNEIDISGPVAALHAIASGELPVAPLPPEPRPAAPEAMAPLPTDGDIPPSEDGMAIGKTETSIRVSVGLLDQLMTLAGELVLSRNQLLQTISSGAVPEAEAVGQRIDLVTSELQGAIMLTRMQPIGNVLGKFPRVVRDLAKKLGKEVELNLVGKEVELDKTIIEAISDPLTHLVRNSIDHGIESPEERQGLGKPGHGTLLLKAYHAAGQVVIEINDDGRGIDSEQLAATAVAKGRISADQAKLMSAKEKLNLIFLPGFSTADKVTDVSGRGLGMDLIKVNLDQLGGTLEIDSVVGQGTRIAIKLPLTLAIIPSQIIMTREERYAIPQANLEELLRIPAAQIKERIERVGDAEVVRLRGTLLPLTRLSDILGIKRTYYDEETGNTRSDRRHNIADRRSRTSPLFDPAAPIAREPETAAERRGADRRQSPSCALNIVVVTTGAFRYGLIVDRLLDSEEIVIKPLGRHLQSCQGYAGATIMGDGRIALILDIADLARMARLTSLEGSRRSGELVRESLLKRQDRQALLTFRSAQEEQFAVPLSLVERVEKIKRCQIEAIGSRRVMQYRGGSLPLLSVDEVAAVLPLADQDNLLVIVFHLKGKDIGLLASGPVDAIEVSVEIDAVTLRQTGIMGSAIIGGTTTMLVDIFELVEALHPEWFGDAAACGGGDVPQVLIVDDSEFFRNLVRIYLEGAGFRVMEAVDGLDAWQVLETDHETIGLVVTDIEMPNLDGFELTERIKHSSRFAHLPVIALTTLAAEEDIARGKAAGVEEYHIKLDRERLVEGVCRCLQATVAA